VVFDVDARVCHVGASTLCRGASHGRVGRPPLCLLAQLSRVDVQCRLRVQVWVFTHVASGFTAERASRAHTSVEAKEESAGLPK
jgi:hypothetical protein